jgi:hypothetical protein
VINIYCSLLSRNDLFGESIVGEESQGKIDHDGMGNGEAQKSKNEVSHPPTHRRVVVCDTGIVSDLQPDGRAFHKVKFN